MPDSLNSLYEALTAAGAPKEMARRAAIEMTDLGKSTRRLESGVGRLEERVNHIEAKTGIFQWMMGVNLAMTASIMFMMIG